MSFISIRTKPVINNKPRFTIIVGKSVSKKAVNRNRLKRRIRAIVRSLVKKSAKDYVIIVQPEAAKASFLELKEEIAKKLPNY